MIADNALRLATAEVVPNGGATNGNFNTIGPTSVALALDESGLTETMRGFRDVGSGYQASMSITVDTAFECGTFGATIALQLISLPINATKFDNATSTGKRIKISAAPTDIADADPDLADTLEIANHGLPVGTPIYLGTPVTTTSIFANQIYYVVPTTADRFKLATSLVNAIAGTPTVNMGGGDGTVDVWFIPTVHASTGPLPMFDVGTPTHQGPLRAGSQLIVPIRPLATMTPKSYVRGGHAPLTSPRSQLSPPLRTTAGAGPTSGLIAANPQRFFYLNYFNTHLIAAPLGSITCDLVMTSGNALNYQPTGTEMV